jgi:hypothetical protein
VVGTATLGFSGLHFVAAASSLGWMLDWLSKLEASEGVMCAVVRLMNVKAVCVPELMIYEVVFRLIYELA